MKLLDKLKNALFEEEYVEVEEKPKKKDLKKEIKKEAKKEKIKKEEPIAKKIVQPERKIDNVMDDIDLLDEDFELPQKKEEKPINDFKFPVMEDDDFEMDEPVVKEKTKGNPTLTPKEEDKEVVKPQNKIIKEKKSKPYGLDDFEIPEPEYGLYEKKEERTYFKPSPIISPIYGILDKNYTKDEIKDKKEIRFTSSYAHENLDLDEVRNRAYGGLVNDIEKEFDHNLEPATMEIEEESNQFLDLSSENDTPAVTKVTVGDAEEYFEDLGLEYNVDYKDISKEKAIGRRTQKSYEEEKDDIRDDNPVEQPPVKEQVNQDDDDDNLFDLIDSMYDKE